MTKVKKDPIVGARNFCAVVDIKLELDNIFPLQYQQQFDVLQSIKQHIINDCTTQEEKYQFLNYLPNDLQNDLKQELEELKQTIGEAYRQYLPPESREEYQQACLAALKTQVEEPIIIQLNEIKELQRLLPENSPQYGKKFQELVEAEWLKVAVNIKARLTEQREYKNLSDEEKNLKINQAIIAQEKSSKEVIVKKYRLSIELTNIDTRLLASPQYDAQLFQDREKFIQEYKVEHAIENQQMTQQARTKWEGGREPRNQNVDQHPLVRAGILLPDEVKYFDYPLLNILEEYSEEYYENQKELFEIARNLDPKDKKIGFQALSAVIDDNTLILLQPEVLKLLKLGNISFTNIDYIDSRDEYHPSRGEQVDVEPPLTFLDFVIKHTMVNTLKKLIDDNKIPEQDKSSVELVYEIFNDNKEVIEAYKDSKEPALNSHISSLLIDLYIQDKKALKLVSILSMMQLDAEIVNLALHGAVKHEDIQAIKGLLVKGAAIEAQDKKGKTPLHWAAIKGNTEAIELLLEKGAAIEAQANNGRTALHWAAYCGCVKAIELLLKKGAAIEAQANNGSTPLHWAAFVGNVKEIELLLNNKAEIEAQDKDGRTALHWAVHARHVKAIKLLLNHGAKIEAQDKDGRTALQLALEMQQEEIVKILTTLRVSSSQPSSATIRPVSPNQKGGMSR